MSRVFGAIALMLLSACAAEVITIHQFEGAPIHESICSACFPECANDGTTHCVTSMGSACDMCVVGCIGGNRIECLENDPLPYCPNLLAGSETEFPVICVVPR